MTSQRTLVSRGPPPGPTAVLTFPRGHHGGFGDRSHHIADSLCGSEFCLCRLSPGPADPHTSVPTSRLGVGGGGVWPQAQDLVAPSSRLLHLPPRFSNRFPPRAGPQHRPHTLDPRKSYLLPIPNPRRLTRLLAPRAPSEPELKGVWARGLVADSRKAATRLCSRSRGHPLLQNLRTKEALLARSTGTSDTCFL